MENNKICTVVTGNTIEIFIDNLEKIQKISDFLELRIDYIDNLSLNDLEIIKKKTEKKTIFTCRTKDEGGNYKGNDEERKKIIEKADTLRFDYIDIEQSAIHLFDIKKFRSTIIVSFHDFT